MTASAAVLPFTEITAENIDSFHFHGREETYPISTVIAKPDSRKDQTLLLGRYASVRTESAQCVKPTEVVDDLMSIVFRVEQLVWLSSVLSAVVTGLLLALVLFLSIRLREKEMKTMFKIGCSRFTVVTLIGAEILMMSSAGILLATGAAFISHAIAAERLRSLLF